MIHPTLYSSRSEDYETPQQLFDELHAEFQFTLDPCATPENAKCAKFYTIEQDGLAQSWRGERVFMNPPYGKQISRWMEKISNGEPELAVALVHARTDTKWWHTFVEDKATEIRFIKGRVRFGGAPNSSPFPSVIVIYGQCQYKGWRRA